MYYLVCFCVDYCDFSQDVISAVTEESVKLWIENEKLLFADKGASSALSNWKLTYFMLLQSYFFIQYNTKGTFKEVILILMLDFSEQLTVGKDTKDVSTSSSRLSRLFCITFIHAKHK